MYCLYLLYLQSCFIEKIVVVCKAIEIKIYKIYENLTLISHTYIEWVLTLELTERQGTACLDQNRNLRSKWLQQDLYTKPLSL